MFPKKQQFITAAEYQALIKKPEKPDRYALIKAGTVCIGGKIFYARSSWEVNIAAYFQFQKEHGFIKDWNHEARTFWFTDWIKRGVVSYLPDFEIIANDGRIYYVEVKGYMDARSRTKIKRMRKYYPQFELQVIDKKIYASIAKNKQLYKFWGLLQ